MFRPHKENEQTSVPEEYFRQRALAAREFCDLFPGKIDFTDKTVLEVGCGYGSLCFYAAERGAKRIIGIDINEKLISNANLMLSEQYAEYCNRIEFRCSDVGMLSPEKYDVILSESSFEHILDPKACLQEMVQRLTDKGRIYIGFGPLFQAPWGDHRRMKAPLHRVFPWAHLIFPESWLINHRNRRHPEQQISSLQDLGLNGYSLHQFLTLFYDSGLKVSFIKVNLNPNKRLFVRLVDVMRLLPGLREYLSKNLYCILER